jgi:thiol:disulfide interchange protein
MEIMKNMRRARVICLTALLLTGSSVAGQAETKSAGYDPRRDPAADVRAAVQVAGRSGKRILLEVGGEWCLWCHVLDDLVAGDKEVGKQLRDGFVVVKVNWSPENENVRFLAAYPPIPGYPHFFVLESNGTYLHSQRPDAFTQGNNYDRSKLLAFLKQWSPQPKKKP